MSCQLRGGRQSGKVFRQRRLRGNYQTETEDEGQRAQALFCPQGFDRID
jgi:hypothetical protein